MFKGLKGYQGFKSCEGCEAQGVQGHKGASQLVKLQLPDILIKMTIFPSSWLS